MVGAPYLLTRPRLDGRPRLSAVGRRAAASSKDKAHRPFRVRNVVQLLTLVVDHSGELRDVPHAEWSVRLIF